MSFQPEQWYEGKAAALLYTALFTVAILATFVPFSIAVKNEDWGGVAPIGATAATIILGYVAYATYKVNHRLTAITRQAMKRDDARLRIRHHSKIRPRTLAEIEVMNRGYRDTSVDELELQARGPRGDVVQSWQLPITRHRRDASDGDPYDLLVRSGEVVRFTATVPPEYSVPELTEPYLAVKPVLGEGDAVCLRAVFPEQHERLYIKQMRDRVKRGA